MKEVIIKQEHTPPIGFNSSQIATVISQMQGGKLQAIYIDRTGALQLRDLLNEILKDQ